MLVEKDSVRSAWAVMRLVNRFFYYTEKLLI